MAALIDTLLFFSLSLLCPYLDGSQPDWLTALVVLEMAATCYLLNKSVAPLISDLINFD